MRFESTSAMEDQAILQRQQPAEKASIRSDVVVPLVQALATGFLVAVVVVLVLGKAGGPRAEVLMRVFVLVDAGVTLAVWLALLVETRRLLWLVEWLVDRDLDAEKIRAKRRKTLARGDLVFVNRQRAKAEASRERERQAEKSEFEWFESFVRRLPAKGTSLAAWEAEIGRERWSAYRDALIDFGYARWGSYDERGLPNKTQGWSIVEEPEQILESMSRGAVV